MGCTSTKLSFREVFDRTREAFPLERDCGAKDISSCYTLSQSRTELVAAAKAFSNTSCSDEKAITPENAVSTDTSFTADNTVPALTFLRFAENRWRLSGIHAFHCVWPTRCAMAVMNQRNDVTRMIVPTDQFGAWEVRAWMVMTCEGVRVLAIMEETKALPKTARKALAALAKQKRPFSIGQFPSTAHEQQRIASSELARAMETCASVHVQPSHLSKAFVQRVKSEMPVSLSTLKGPGEPVGADAVAIVRGAATYWRTALRDDVMFGATSGNNPFVVAKGTSGTALEDSAVAPSSGGCCGGGSPGLGVPLLGLVEWLSLRVALSFLDTNAHGDLHPSSLPEEEEEEEAEEEACPFATDGSDSPSPSPLLGTTPVRPPPPVVTEKTMTALERLAWVLRRLHELDVALASGTLLHDERARCAEEKATLEAELQILFDRVTKGRSEMLKEDGRDGLYEALTLNELFPIKAVHDGLSDCAYDSAIGHDAARDRSDVPSIHNLWRFRLYLAAYLSLTDLYSDVVKHHGVAQSGDAVTPLAYDTFFPVMGDVQARDPALMEGVPVAGDHQGDHDMGRIISLFQQLAKMAPGDEREHHFVPFEALCKFVTDRVVEMYKTVRTPLRPLEELREELAVAETVGERDLDACAEHLRCALSALTDDGEDTLSQARLVDTIVAQASLFEFSYSATEAADAVVVFSSLVERTLQPAPRDRTEDATCTQSAQSSLTKRSSCASWLALVRAEGKPVFANLVAYSTYAATAVYRCVEDTKPTSLHDATADGTPFNSLGEETQLPFEWFLAALTFASDSLGLETTALVANASNILEARDAMMGPEAIATQAPSHLSAAPLPAADVADDGSGTELAQEQNVSEAKARLAECAGSTSAQSSPSSAHVTRAFLDMTRLNASCAKEVSGGAAPGGTVLLRDVAYVCVFHYTQHFFGTEPLLRQFFSSDAYSARETRQLDADGAALRALLAKMPLHDVAKAYAEFFAFSGGAHAVCLEDCAVHEGEVPVRVFCTALFVHYREELAALNVSEVFLLELCREAIERVGTVVASDCADTPAGTSTEGTRTLLFAKDYQRFLQYIAGTLLARSTYDALSASHRKVVLDADGVPTKIVDTTFVRRLLFFLEQEQGAGTFDYSLDAAATFTELQQQDIDLYGGAVSLQTASVWYGRLWASQTPQCALDWWQLCAGSIPWRNSAPHCEGRRELTAALATAMRTALGLTGTDVDADAPWSSLSDGYIPHAVLAATLHAQYPDLYWAATVMRRGLPAPLDLSDRDDAESSALWLEWVRVCMARTNLAVSREDLDDAELHVTDVRWLLSYMHHHATTFFAGAEAQKEVRAMRTAAAQANTGETEQANMKPCVYGDADYQRALKAQLNRLLGRALGEDALCAAMTALQTYAADHADEEVDDDVVAHLLTAALVRHTARALHDDNAAQLEEAEAARLRDFERQVFLGTSEFNASRSPCGTYWERLRLILPSGQSQKHRQLRREVFHRMDVRGRHFLTMSDIYQGALDVLHLEQYRTDVLPVLFRAFFATKESDSRSSNEKGGVVYLDSDGDQILLPSEFRMFLGYVYRYMELYFLFDALTASGRVDGHTLHVDQADAQPSSAAGSTSTGMARTTTPVLESVPAPRGPDEAPYAPGDALFLAAEAPYRLTMETANLPKEVSQDQFASAHRVLRHWGVRVRPEQMGEIFRHISRRCEAQGSMHFTAFAIWASEHNLRPEGYAHSRAADAQAS